MENKELDQFMCDHFSKGETIAVDCKWLQKQLMQLESLKRVNRTISERLCLLDALNECRDYDMPDYKLNIKV
jgi:hypothetical protein